MIMISGCFLCYNSFTLFAIKIILIEYQLNTLFFQKKFKKMNQLENLYTIFAI